MSNTASEIPVSQLTDGIIICENLIDQYIQDAQRYRSKGNLQLAYILGFSAWEECGKACYILDHLTNNKPIPRGEWTNKQSFMGHIPKIRKAREEGILNAFEGLKARHPEYPKIKLVDLEAQPQILKKYWNYRMNCLYLSYDFDNNTWHTHKDYKNLDALTEKVISNAVVSFMDLQETLQKRGIETPWTFQGSFEVKI